MGKDLFRYKGMKRILTLITCLTLIQTAAIIMQAEWLSEAVTGLFNGKGITSLLPVIGFFLIAFIARHGMTVARQKIVYQYAARTGADLRKSFLDQLFRLGPRFAKKEGTGQMVTLAMEGISQFRRYLELFLPKMVSMAIVPAAVVIYVFFQDRTSAIILVAAMPILIIFMILLGLVAQRKADRQWKSYQRLSNHFVDSLRGLETLRFLGLSKSHSKNIFYVSERYRKATMSTLRVAFLSSFALDFFTMLSVATVAVFLGLRLIDGDILLGPALTALILAPEYFLPVREVGNDYHATLNGQEAGKTIQEILSQPGFKEETPLQLEASFLNSLNTIGPTGWTPIAKALNEAKSSFDQLDAKGEKVVYLLTDGEETCGGNPIKTAKELQKDNITVNVIGFDYKEGYKGQLNAIAKVGGGEYFPAYTQKDVEKIFTQQSLMLSK